METNVNYTIVGTFVIVLTSALILLIIWMSSGFSSQEFTTYQVYMRESVSGLSAGAPVEFNGVTCGTVSDIKISSKNPQLVMLYLKVIKDIPITSGTRAKLEIRSLGGSTYIQLVDKGLDRRPIKIPPGQKYALIPAVPSTLVKLTTMVNEISQSFNQISQSINNLLDKENLYSIKESLANIRVFTNMLSKDSEKIDEFFHNAAKASSSFKTQTLPDANKAISNISDLSEDLSNLSGEIKRNPAVIIRGKAPYPLGPGE